LHSTRRRQRQMVIRDRIKAFAGVNSNPLNKSEIKNNTLFLDFKIFYIYNIKWCGSQMQPLFEKMLLFTGFSLLLEQSEQ
ncbi:MAG: hypothetical protein K2G51_14895, partial [Lachnospiraceae bacterium]|nr:hypothetical protein [Lachnospiraceae bacterium]